MQAIVGAHVVAEVERPPVVVDYGVGGTDESRRSVRIDEVPAGSARSVVGSLDSGRRALGVAEHQAVHVQALPLPEALVGREKTLLANDGATQGPAESIPLEGMRIRGVELEEIAGIERIVPKELERLAAKYRLPDLVTMFTMAPDTWPCSALNAELSTLNSSMLAIGGWNISEPNVRLLG